MPQQAGNGRESSPCHPFSLVSAVAVDDVTIVAASRPLARQVAVVYAGDRNGEHAVSMGPGVYAWNDWLRDAWLRCARRDPRAPVLLSEVQTTALWETVIAKAEWNAAPHALLDIPGTARAARAAWRLLNDWELSVADIDPGLNDDAAAFVRWARAFTRALTRGGWVDTDSLAGGLVDWIDGGRWRPSGVEAWGFDEPTPRQRHILKSIRARHPTADRIHCRSARSIACENAETELTYAARWSHRRLMSGAAGTIGVVVPDLPDAYPTVARVFSQVFCEGETLAEFTNRRPYSILSGGVLSEHPLVDAALLLLRFMGGLSSSAELGRLLRTPFCRGATQEFAARSALDEQLRRRAITALGPAGLWHWLRRAAGGQMVRQCPQLEQVLTSAAAFVVPRRQSSAQWVASFGAWLEVWGWPGERALNGLEQRAFNVWGELLSDFAGVSLLRGEIDQREAVRALVRAARDRRYPLLADAAPIWVMTPNQTMGMRFDGLWITGMSELQWPPAVRPNPFLPAPLQRRLGMPRADPNAALAYARRVAQRWSDHAVDLVVSYPLRHNQQQAGLSAIFSDLAPVAPETLNIATRTYAQRLNDDRPALERRPDLSGPPLVESPPVRGGAGVLRDQSLCPFRAFARYRLHVRAIEEAETGLDARDRGVLVHQCLAQLWRTSNTRSLLTGSEAERRMAVEQAVQAVVSRWPVRGGVQFHAALVTLERARLVSLLEEWLACERARDRFTVAACEHEVSTGVGGLPLRLRIDRIDRLDDGSLFVIDYKTGAPQKPEQWFGGRPDDPQLPAYAIAMENLGESVNGLAFAEVSRGACRWTGVKAAKDDAPGIRTIEGIGVPGIENWAQARLHWRTVLTELARQFAAGDARVAPKREQVCRHCEAGPLCRIAERAHSVLGPSSAA